MYMNIKITENQLNHINEIERLKKTLFKYWDMKGGIVDNTLLSMFGAKNNRLKIGNQTITIQDFQNWLYDWRGEEQSKKLAETFLNKNPHRIECGGYDFEFDVWEYQIDGRSIDITPRINDRRGRVILMMDDGRVMNLYDAISNEDFGWEIENEIQDCLYEYFSVHLSDELGYSFVFDYFLFTSDEGI